MVKIRKTSQNGTAFVLVADTDNRRLVVYEETSCTVYHSQTLLEPPCGRLGVHAERGGAVYFEINADEVAEIVRGMNHRTLRTNDNLLINADFVRTNYAGLPVTRQSRSRARRMRSESSAPAPVPPVNTVSTQRTAIRSGAQRSINAYHSSQRPGVFVRSESIENGDELGMGIELEVVHPNGRTPATETAILNAVADSGFTPADCLVETDASVTFEIVFNAWTIEQWRESAPKLTALCNALKSAGFDSERGGRCGLHTHISRNYLRENGDALLYAVHMNNANFFKMLSRRGNTNDAYWQFRTCDLNRLMQEKETGNNHHIAINNGNRHTVELRYWRGTLNATRIIQQLEFIQQLVDAINARDTFELLYPQRPPIIETWFTGAAREYIHYRKTMSNNNDYDGVLMF